MFGRQARREECMMSVRICKPTVRSWVQQSLFDLWPVVCVVGSVVALLNIDTFAGFYRRSTYPVRLAVLSLVFFVCIAMCRYSFSMLRMSWEIHNGTVCFDANAIWIATRFGTLRVPWATLTSAELRQRKNTFRGLIAC